MPGQCDAPTEVEIVAEQRQLGVEAADVVPHVPAHQHPRGAHREYVAITVMLAMVELAVLEAGLPPSAAIDGMADLDQHPAVLPVAKLRTDDSGRRHLIGEVEQSLERVGRRRAVVVQQPQPLDRRTVLGAGRRETGRVREGRDRAMYRCTEPAVARCVEDARCAEGSFGQRPGLVMAFGVDDDEPLNRAALRFDRVERRR